MEEKKENVKKEEKVREDRDNLKRKEGLEKERIENVEGYDD